MPADRSADADLVRRLADEIFRAVPEAPRRRGRPLRADRLTAALVAAAVIARRSGELPRFSRGTLGEPAGELMHLLREATACGDAGERHARRAVEIAAAVDREASR